MEELLVKSKNLRATNKLDEVVAWSDLIFIFVNTPTGMGEKSYDHGNLSNVLLQLAGLPVEGKNIVISCTVQPGYTGSVASYLMRDSGATLSYNPEFIAQGAIVQGLWYPDIILIGEGSKQAGDELCHIYEKMCKSKPVYHRMTPHEAEITKLSINCFITMKISFANMIGLRFFSHLSLISLHLHRTARSSLLMQTGDIAIQSNCNPDAILQAVGGDSRIGTKYLKPGYGYGGPCFPRDNRALATYARSVGVDAKLSVASDEFNKTHAEYQFQRFLKANLPLYEFKGVAYRDNCPVPLIEESQKLAVAKV